MGCQCWLVNRFVFVCVFYQLIDANAELCVTKAENLQLQDRFQKVIHWHTWLLACTLTHTCMHAHCTFALIYCSVLHLIGQKSWIFYTLPIFITPSDGDAVGILGRGLLLRKAQCWDYQCQVLKGFQGISLAVLTRGRPNFVFILFSAPKTRFLFFSLLFFRRKRYTFFRCILFFRRNMAVKITENNDCFNSADARRAS